MARPRKQPHERRRESVRADLTLAEKEHVREQARLAGISEAEYVRRCVLGVFVTPAPAKVDASLISTLNSLVLQLQKWGNLANQLARAIHTGGTFVHDWRDVRNGIRETTAEASNILARVARSYGGS